MPKLSRKTQLTAIQLSISTEKSAIQSYSAKYQLTKLRNQQFKGKYISLGHFGRQSFIKNKTDQS